MVIPIMNVFLVGDGAGFSQKFFACDFSNIEAMGG
jgi:hypothetical protein